MFFVPPRFPVELNAVVDGAGRCTHVNNCPDSDSVLSVQEVKSPPSRVCSEEAAQPAALTTVTLNYKAARSVLTDASDRSLSRLSMLLRGWLCFFGLVRSEVNKWQNRHSQSRFWPPDRAPRRHVLQLEPYDASPWLFSVNSALSRPSILPGCLMSQQSLPSQPHPPPPFSAVHWYTVIVTSLIWSYREKAVYLTEQKLYVSPVPATSLEMSSRKERWASSLSCVRDSVLITCETTSQHMVEHISDADQPLSSPQWFPFLLPIHQPLAMKIAGLQDGVYPGPFSGCQATLSFRWFGQE